MRVFLLSPESVPMNPVLFPMMRQTFIERGYTFNQEIYYSDIIMLDMHTRISDYSKRDIEWVLNSRAPIITFDEFDKGGMSDLVWPYPLTAQQKQIIEHIEKNDIKSVHFCRLLDKTKSYPPNLHPYEKPILYEEPLCTEEEIFNRPYDIVWIANTAPQREAIAKALIDDGRLKCNIILGAKKIPLNEWIAEHRKGKLFVSCSAGGYSNECVQHLFSVAGQLREKNDQLLLHDFTDCVNCIKIWSPPTKDDIDTIYEIVNDSEYLYDVYRDGYDFVKHFYSPQYITNNIIDTIEKHLK